MMMSMHPVTTQAATYNRSFHQRTTAAMSLCCALLIMPCTAFALLSDQNKPIELEADHATYNEKTGVTTYQGNVIVNQGTIRIAADTFVANLDANRSIINATANGNPAKFQQQLEKVKGISKGEGKNLVYDAQNSIVTLTGDAWLTHNGASFKGDSLRYSMNLGDVEAIGSSSRRVKLVIPPNLNHKSSSAKTR